MQLRRRGRFTHNRQPQRRLGCQLLTAFLLEMPRHQSAKIAAEISKGCHPHCVESRAKYSKAMTCTQRNVCVVCSQTFNQRKTSGKWCYTIFELLKKVVSGAYTINRSRLFQIQSEIELKQWTLQTFYLITWVVSEGQIWRNPIGNRALYDFQPGFYRNPKNRVTRRFSKTEKPVLG
jgi:hypothetical protein